MKISLLSMALLFTGFSMNAQITFTDQTGLLMDSYYGTHAVGVSDMNGDGLDDILTLEDGNDLVIWFQQENNMFTVWEYGAFGEDGGGWGGSDAWAIAMADLDGNGICDIFAGGSYDDIKIGLINETTDDIEVYVADAPNIFVQGTSFFDFNNDGHTDVFSCHDDGPSLILLNDGSGNLIHDQMAADEILNTSLNGEGEEGSGNYGTVFSDVNGDNYADLYIAKCRQGVSDSSDPRRINQLWIYDPLTGVFNEEAEERGLADGAQTWAADFADIDGDGDMDCFAGNHDQVSRIYINDGTGYFTDGTEAAGLSNSDFPFAVIQCTFRDFDNDGDMDLFASGSGNHTMGWNNGDGTFTVSNDAFQYGMNSFACGDLNNDGFTDFFATEGGYGGWGADSPDAVLINLANDNNWFKLCAKGTESNPDGIGAKIVIEGPFGTQIREIRAGESYGIQNTMTAMFGLGTFETIDMVTIYWPSGIVDEFADVAINETLEVEEGEAVVSVNDIANDIAFSLYPNPATDNITISFEGNMDGYEIHDALGRTVLSAGFNSTQIQNINVQNLSSGSYSISILNDGVRVANEGFIVK